MGFGNVCYLALWAWRQRRAGVDAWVLATPTLDRWSGEFPRLGDLAIPRKAVKPTDARRTAMASYGRFGEDFTREEVHDFVTQVLPLGVADPTDDSIVINVRRGDYYSVPEHRGALGFDVDQYLRVTVPAAIEAQGPVRRIHVVSDGPDWCRARLGWLADWCDQLTWADPADPPARNFRDVATARRIIMTNSTFSYWAGYVHDVVHPGAESSVWGPWFFMRGIEGGRAWQLDPRWSIVRDIPGGWDS